MLHAQKYFLYSELKNRILKNFKFIFNVKISPKFQGINGFSNPNYDFFYSFTSIIVALKPVPKFH